MAAGDVAGFRRVFSARVGGTELLASHAGILGRLLSAPVSPVWLACRLANPEAPAVLRDTLTPFVGVNPVPAGHYVELARGWCRTERWWVPPSPEVPSARGALVLAEALALAVADRIRQAAGPVSVQLSGGLDSTALAFLASPARPVLVTVAGRSPASDDLAWAEHGASLLPGCPHRVITADAAPLFFSGLDSVPVLDEPASFAAGAARQQHVAAVLSGYGAVLNFNGQGGDEVLLAPLAYLRGALRSVARTGWRHLRGHAARTGVRVPALAVAVAHRQSYAEWLRSAAAALGTEPSAADRLAGWEAQPTMPPWATSDAVSLVGAAIRRAEPVPLAEDRAAHAALVRIRASACRAGLYRDAMGSAGVPTAMPYLDRAVIEACLSVLPWERTDPWQPKPLLRAALAAAPDGLLSRRTKSDYNADIYHGWAVHRSDVADLLAGSRLANYGLIGLGQLRRCLAAFGSGRLPPAWVTDLIAIEAWLRDLDRGPGQPPPAEHPARLANRSVRDRLPAARLAVGVRATPAEDGVALLDNRSGVLYHLNRSAAVVLAALVNSTADEDGALGIAASALAERYRIPYSQARADATALLDDLSSRGLLTRPAKRRAK